MAENNDLSAESREEEEFNSLLNAAAKMVNKNSDNGDSGEGASSGSVSSVRFSSGGSGKLTEEAIEALLNSAPPKESIDDAFIDKVMSEQDPLAEPSASSAPDTGATAVADDTDKIASMLGAGLPSDDDDENDVTVLVNNSPDGIPDEIIGKKRSFGFIITLAAAVVAAALGFCVCLLLFGNLFKSSDEEFAILAANAVNSSLPVNNELYIYKAFVKNGSAAKECILYGVVDYNGETRTDIFRVVLNNDNPDKLKLKVYFTLDENDEDYIAMKNSEDSEKKIQASVRKNYSDSIYAADKEIRIGVPEWKSTDCGIINKNITSEQVKEDE